MPRDNSSKRMFAKWDKEDALMWERRYNICFETRDKLHKQLDECVDMRDKLHKQLDECVNLLDRILLHVDVGYTNPSMETEIKEFLKKIR